MTVALAGRDHERGVTVSISLVDARPVVNSL
jgi:hypothetical protein